MPDYLSKTISFQNKPVLVYCDYNDRNRNVYIEDSIDYINLKGQCNNLGSKSYININGLSDYRNVNSDSIYISIDLFKKMIYGLNDKRLEYLFNEFVKVLELCGNNQSGEWSPNQEVFKYILKDNVLVDKAEKYEFVARFQYNNSVFIIGVVDLPDIEDCIKIMQNFYGLIDCIKYKTTEIIDNTLTNFYSSNYNNYENYICSKCK